MAIDAVTNVSSDAGSPMGGAIDPGTARRISELGSHSTPNAVGMQRLDGPEPQELGDVKPMTMHDITKDPGEVVGDEMQVLEQDSEVAEGQQTHEQLAKEYQELMDSAELPLDKFGDKVIWYDSDGKGAMVPIRLQDIPNNILMYNDYQRKTTEVAERGRQLDGREAGMKQFRADVISGDPEVGLRAWRAIGGEKTMREMVIHYINEQATLEKLPPNMQARFMKQQQLEDDNFYLQRREQHRQRQAEQQQTQQAQEQGAAAPDITFVQQTIINSLPETYKSLGISEVEHTSDAFQYELDRIFTAAATGERNADGSWKSAPTIQRGRAPSKQLIANLVLSAKQNVDKLFSSPHAKRLGAPRKVATNTPLTGTGPAPAQGQRGNISAPQRMRWSDMGKPQRSNNG